MKGISIFLALARRFPYYPFAGLAGWATTSRDREAMASLPNVTILESVPEIDGISAGGMPTRVKCLHALVGHSLAAGAGVNPIGDLALERCAWSPTVCECANPFSANRSPAEPSPVVGS